MKKTVSVLILFVLVLSLIPINAFASPYEDAYNKVCAGIEAMETKIDIKSSRLNEAQLKTLVNDVLGNNPYFFYVDTKYKYSGYNGVIYSLIPQYTMTKAEVKNATADFDKRLNKIVALLPKGLDDAEKALFFHDYLCLNFEYDRTYSVYDAYTMLKKGKGVCQAYSRLYDALLEKVNIDSLSVQSDSMNHAWNAVKIGGKYYHVDVTWDDPIPDEKGLVLHEYFLLSDKGIQSRKHHDYSGAPACSDKKYDYMYWRDYRKAFGFADGKIFLLNGRDIEQTDISNGKIRTVRKIEDTWKVWGKTSYYEECFSGFGSYKDHLLFNTPTAIFALDPETGKCQEILDLSDKQGYVYGFYNIGGKGYYAIAANPNTDKTYQSFDIVIKGNEEPEEPEKPVDPDKPLTGDINGDGKVTSADYTMCKRAVLGTYVLSEKQLIAADVDGNGKITVKDYALLKRAVLGTFTLAA